MKYTVELTNCSTDSTISVFLRDVTKDKEHFLYEFSGELSTIVGLPTIESIAPTCRGVVYMYIDDSHALVYINDVKINFEFNDQVVTITLIDRDEDFIIEERKIFVR